MKNGQVELDGVIIPYCEEWGEKWYPIKYIVEQFLLKAMLMNSVDNIVYNKGTLGKEFPYFMIF